MKSRIRPAARSQSKDGQERQTPAPLPAQQDLASPQIDAPSGTLMGNMAALGLVQRAPLAHSAGHDVGGDRSWGSLDLGGGGDDADDALGGGGQSWSVPLQRKANGRDAGVLGAQASISDATSEAGHPLPESLRQGAEASLGTDLSSVQVHTGSKANRAAADVSAKAYAQGSDIYFGSGQYQPGSAGGDALIAHELVHVAQQEGNSATPQASLQVSQAHEPAEVEADLGAQAILAGRPFSPSASPAPVARTETLSGNPQEWRNNPTGPDITTHRAPTLQDASNHTAPTAATNEAVTTNARVVASEAHKLHLEPPSSPDTSLVYEESAEQSSPPEPGFTTITQMQGTMLAPQVAQEADDSIFINGAPSANDVQQMSIGDCYFLATLQSILSQDPNKISSMMTPTGNGGATVTFWRRQEHDDSAWEWLTGSGPEYDYIPVAVTVNEQLAVRISNGHVFGAQLRCAEGPKATDWWSRISGTNLEVHRDETFECARWAPLMEKAFARFSEAHGTSGGAHGDSGGGRGYNNINGGVPYYTMSLFYGAEADNSSSDTHRQDIVDAQEAPGSDLLVRNAAVIDQLLLLAGRPEQAGPGEADAPILVAVAFVDDLIGRLKAGIPTAQADADYANLSGTQQANIAAVLAAINAWEALPPDPAGAGPAGPKATAKRAIGTASSTAVQPGPPNAAGLAALQALAPATIQFEQGEHEVPQPMAPMLAGFGGALDATTDPAVNVDLVGHSSSEGTEERNMDLSFDRADAVADAIEGARDLTPHVVDVDAEGEMGADATPAWRRVNITVAPQDATNTLHADERSQAIREIMDLMLDLKNIGTDASPGQRNIYGDHAYQVLGASFVNSTGDHVALENLPSSMRVMLYPLVDPTGSTVRLRNPHHTNEPDRMDNNQPTRPEDGAPDGATADGMFTMNLVEFFRNFSAVDSGVFPTTP